MPQPTGASLRPGGAGMVAGANPEVVGGCGINMQLRGNTRPLQGQIRHHAVTGVADDVVSAVPRKIGGVPAGMRRPGASSSLSLAFR